MKANRIKAILNDTDFLGVVQQTRDTLTKKVMAKATSEDERLELLAEYHALDTLMNRMRSEAHNAREEE